MFEKGLNVPEVASISGHKTVRQLFRYAQVNGRLWAWGTFFQKILYIFSLPYYWGKVYLLIIFHQFNTYSYYDCKSNKFFREKHDKNY